MQFGRYQVVRMLGQGGMATVYEACDPRLNQRVAIKVLHAALASSPELIARFEAEARIVNGLHHAGIVSIYDQGRLHDGAVYHVMELLEGETLGQRLKRGAAAPLRPDETYRIIRQIADTLCTVHFHGIVHRDLKPDNLMLVPDAFVPGGVRVKILDFGLAKVVNDNAKPHGIDTQVGTGLGTVDYMPPEQILDARNSNDRADVYALGCILFEMAAGRKPFLGENNIEVLGAHLTRPPPILTEHTWEHPRQLSNLIVAMMCKEVAQRPTMRQVVRHLDAVWGIWVRQSSNTVVMGSKPMPGPPRRTSGARSAVPPKSAPPQSRRTLAAVAVGTAALCLPLLLWVESCLPRGWRTGGRPTQVEQVQDGTRRPGSKGHGDAGVERRGLHAVDRDGVRSAGMSSSDATTMAHAAPRPARD